MKAANSRSRVSRAPYLFISMLAGTRPVAKVFHCAQRPGNTAIWNGPYLKTGSVPTDP